jgi:hypothetical protein
VRVTEVSILDTFGTKSGRFSPKSICRISGPNGCGKSSIIRGLARCFEGGSDPSIIRAGAEKSIVEFLTDDGSKYTRTCAPVKRRKGEDPTAPTRYSTTLEILQPDGTPRPAPQTYINSLADSTAVDPGKILRIDATTVPGRKALAEILLEIMPLSFTAEEIAAKLSADYRDGSEIARLDIAGLALPAIDKALDLDGLKRYCAVVTEQRRRVGATRDDSDGAVNRLRQSLPEDDGTDYADALREAEKLKADGEAELAAMRSDIEKQKHAAIQQATNDWSAAVAAVNADIDAKIKALEVERASRNEAAHTERDRKKDEIATLAQREIEAIDADARPAYEELIRNIATLKERLLGQQRAAWTREQLEVNLTACREASRKYQQLSEVIVRLEQLRKEKLDSLPVAGLEVSGEQVFVDGVPWQNVNTARKIEVALQLCTLRAGKLGILFLDDAEHLDTEMRLMLEREIANAGFQLFEAIVSDDQGLTIETFEPVAA